MHRRDITQRRMIFFAEPHAMAVEGEDGEPLMRIAADPYWLALEPAVGAARAQSRRLGTLADHCDVRLQRQDALDLSIESHVAIPGDYPHRRPMTRKSCVLTIAHAPAYVDSGGDVRRHRRFQVCVFGRRNEGPIAEP